MASRLFNSVASLPLAWQLCRLSSIFLFRESPPMAGLFGLLTGRTLRNRYRVDRLISKGGMGAVFLGTDGELDRQVAIKVIAMEPQSPEEEASLRARFRREARAAARLQHPNVVTLYDVGSDEETGLDFIVMELLKGEDLQQRLRRAGPLPVTLALEVLHGAGCGLGAGHRQGLVHRDVKPANLFLEEAAAGHPARVRVLDFGIAQVLENSAATVTKLTVYGGGPLSPPYAAPEQLRGVATLTPACDVFSLGCTAFELLTGVLPFNDAQRERMRHGEPVPPPQPSALAARIPPEIDELIIRALSPRPEDRQADGDAFAAQVADTAQALGTFARAGFLPPIVDSSEASQTLAQAQSAPRPAATPAPLPEGRSVERMPWEDSFSTPSPASQPLPAQVQQAGDEEESLESFQAWLNSLRRDSRPETRATPQPPAAPPQPRSPFRTAWIVIAAVIAMLAVMLLLTPSDPLAPQVSGDESPTTTPGTPPP